jgi:hypothetical protein
MVQIATNTPSGLGCRSRNLSREARTLSMSREAVSNLNQCSRVGTDRDGAVSCGSKTLRPECANTGHSPTAWRTCQIDPKGDLPSWRPARKECAHERSFGRKQADSGWHLC